MEITLDIIIIAGIVLLVIVIFQALSGLKIIKTSFNNHKTGGIILTVLALIHAIIGAIYLIGG